MTREQKRETYLCGYDPDEALVMQCGTCRFFQKKYSHCSHNDSLTNAKYKCKDWKFKTNEECVKEASKKHDEEIARLRREIAALEHKYANACKCCDDAERRLKVAEDALEKCVNYNNSWELEAAKENAKNALAVIRGKGGEDDSDKQTSCDLRTP